MANGILWAIETKTGELLSDVDRLYNTREGIRGSYPLEKGDKIVKVKVVKLKEAGK